MKNVFQIRTQLYLVLCIILVTVSCEHQELTEYIQGLTYNPDEVLAYNGEKITTFCKKEGHLDCSNNFIVISRQLKSISNFQADVGVITCNEHRTYPGTLIVANYRLIENNPDTIIIDRAPLKYTVNLPGLTDECSFYIVPTFANYQSALNNVLNTWFTKCPDSDVNGVFESDYSMVNSKEQLRVKFGLEFKGSKVEASIDFDAVDNKEQLIKIIRFKQIFYTVSVEPPSQPGCLFGDDVTVKELACKINNRSPPVLVDSVSYGRVIYVKIQTSSTNNEAKAILESKFDACAFSGGTNNQVDYTKRLDNFNMQVFVIGGGSEQISLVNAKTLEDVNNVITKFGKFGKANPGYPITYSSEFVKDNTRAVVLSSTQYTETCRTEFSSGLLRLHHTGWYIAKWNVEWDEVSINENGEEVRTHKIWDKSGQKLTAPFTEEIQLGGNCENVAVQALEYTGLMWNKWRAVVDRKGIPLVKERTFSISGTTLSPKASIDPPL